MASGNNALIQNKYRRIVPTFILNLAYFTIFFLVLTLFSKTLSRSTPVKRNTYGFLKEVAIPFLEKLGFSVKSLLWFFAFLADPFHYILNMGF